MLPKKYPLDPQFRALTYFAVPISKRFAGAIDKMMRPSNLGLPSRGVSVKHKKIPGYQGEKIPLRIYTPEGLGDDAPCLIYFHGGGFILPPVYYHDLVVKSYAADAGCKVIFPDYRLAPKYAYPYAAEDCYATYQWVLDHADELRIDPSRIAVGGDSAGGDLTAAVTLMARDRGLPCPCFQMLVYPVTDCRMQTPSTARFTDTPVWNSTLSKKMWQFYLPAHPGAHVEYASPMEAPSLEGLPDAYVEVAEFDSLRDEGLAYAARLKEAGISVEIVDTKGAPHGFELAGRTPIVLESLRKRNAALRRGFGLE